MRSRYIGKSIIPCEGRPSMSASTKAAATVCASLGGVPTAISSLSAKFESSSDETSSDLLMRMQPAHGTSVSVTLVGVPGGLHGVVRAVIDLDDDGFFVRQARAVHIALRVAIEAGCSHTHPAACSYVSTR